VPFQILLRNHQKNICNDHDKNTATVFVININSMMIHLPFGITLNLFQIVLHVKVK